MRKPAPMTRRGWAVARRSTKRGSTGSFALEHSGKGWIVPTFWTRDEARAFARRIRIPGFTATPIRVSLTFEAI